MALTAAILVHFDCLRRLSFFLSSAKVLMYSDFIPSLIVNHKCNVSDSNMSANEMLSHPRACLSQKKPLLNGWNPWSC